MPRKKIFSVRIIVFLSLILVFASVQLAKAVIVEENCESLFQKYQNQINQYDVNKDGKIAKTEVLSALDDWLAYRLNSEQFLGILGFSRQNCTAGAGTGQQNDPVSGTLTVSSQNVKTGETITLTVTGKDQNGMLSAWVYYQGRWQSQDCGGATQCTKTFTFSESQPGTYTYWGHIYGKKLDGSREETWASPQNLTVTVSFTGTGGTTPPINGQNDPVSGTLSVSKESPAVNESFEISISARDAQGVESVWVNSKGQWQSFNCNYNTSCTYRWTISEPQAGEFTYYGYVHGRRQDGSKEENYTSPSFVKVRVQEGGGGVTPVTGQIKLPQCSFSGSPGIWAKPKDCGWDTKVLLGSGNRTSCRTWLILEHITADYTTSTPGVVQTIGLAAIGEETDLCKIEPVSLEVLPSCPFSGQVGEVWAKPRFNVPNIFEWTWNMDKCKIGTNCSKSYTFNVGLVAQSLGYSTAPASIPVNLREWIEKLTGINIPWLDFSLSIPIKTTVGPRIVTEASLSGRVACYQDIPPILTGSLPCDFCVVR